MITCYTQTTPDTLRYTEKNPDTLRYTEKTPDTLRYTEKNLFLCKHCDFFPNQIGGCRGRDIMVVGFTTTYAICAYHHRYEFESDPGKGVQHYLIKVVMISDLQQIGGFLWVFWLH